MPEGVTGDHRDYGSKHQGQRSHLSASPPWRPSLASSSNKTPKRQPPLPPTSRRKARTREYAMRHWKQISARYITSRMLAESSGPDGLTAHPFRAIPPGVLKRICNLIRWCGKIPEHLEISRTVFILKKPRALRLFFASFELSRLVHKFLAQETDQLIQLDEHRHNVKIYMIKSARAQFRGERDRSE